MFSGMPLITVKKNYHGNIYVGAILVGLVPESGNAASSTDLISNFTTVSFGIVAT